MTLISVKDPSSRFSGLEDDNKANVLRMTSITPLPHPHYSCYNITSAQD
jgi:hypothetical protein